MEHHIKAVWSDNEDGTVNLRTEIVGESGDVIRVLGSITAQLMEQAERQHIVPTLVLVELGHAIGNAYARKGTLAKESVTVDLSGWTTDKEGRS
nr:MAG TPA: hypothetical protein [Bacteriophage sp.]DAT97783.1 MAG TPA: hypothetical protein [Caudoviricetes sp.]